MPFMRLATLTFNTLAFVVTATRLLFDRLCSLHRTLPTLGQPISCVIKFSPTSWTASAPIVMSFLPRTLSSHTCLAVMLPKLTKAFVLLLPSKFSSQMSPARLQPLRINTLRKARRLKTTFSPAQDRQPSPSPSQTSRPSFSQTNVIVTFSPLLVLSAFAFS